MGRELAAERFRGDRPVRGILLRTGTKPMSATSQLRAGSESLRWTPAWVLVISVLTPASAWALHTVTPDLVAWYLGIMGWLILTPDKGLRFEIAQAKADSETQRRTEPPVNHASAAPTAIARSESADSASSSDPANSDASSTKAKKPRSRARKPKAMTLAEVKALTSSADRAVVWSQVGPGKFVRQPGEDGSDPNMEVEDSRSGPGQVIEAVVSGSTILESDDSDSEEQRERDAG